MAGIREYRWRVQGMALAVGAFAFLPIVGGAAQPEPLVLRYEAYAAGFPVVAFDFRLDESGAGYVVGGQIVGRA